ncbi:MAG TPA: hypothetical protein VN672_03275 [Solirubrobacteraceae bacterium]|nr:hypothetical protein [Solirubrobacteraceae bacterium]
MSAVIVRYKVKPDRVAENERLVRAVYEELAQMRPDGFRYATFRAEDGRSFVHFAIVADGKETPLPSLDSFQRFQREIAQRCEEQPVVSKLSEVGSYRLLEAVSAPA